MSVRDSADRSVKSKHLANVLKGRPHHLCMLLTLMVLASFAVRVAAWAYWQTGAIESEGAEYARIAENLRNGLGYVGIVTPGAQLNFNPLFPLLIAAASFVTHNYEWAGRLVALVMGALLPLPVFGIASHLFNRRVGFIAGILTVLHPLLVNLSFTVFSEGPYTTLLLLSVYLTIVALHQTSVGPWLLVGAAFGLAWLLRAEASAAFAIAVLFALTFTNANRLVICKRAATAILVFLALVVPEVIFIYRSTGKLLLEGKSTIFFYTGKRILAAERNPGVDYESPGGQHEVPSPASNAGSEQPWEDKWAFYGIDSHLKGMGFPMRPHAEVIRATQLTHKDLFLLLSKGVRQNAPVLFYRLSSDWLGAPLLPALALLGAFRRPWRGPQAINRLFILLIGVAPLIGTFFAFWSEARYYFVLVPLLCIWAANGLFEIGLWTKASSAAAGSRMVKYPTVFQYLVPGLIGLAMIISPLKGVRRLSLFTDSAAPTRVDTRIGSWIAHQQKRRVKIMDLSIPLAYHADAEFTYFPYCKGDLALRYLDAAQVDYVILRRGKTFTQYYEQWLAHGIPDNRAEFVPLPSSPGSDKFTVYRWHRGGYDHSVHTAETYVDNKGRLANVTVP